MRFHYHIKYVILIFFAKKRVNIAISRKDEDKKVIKENAQKIKSHLIACGYNSCEDFIVCNEYDYWTFTSETLMDFLPFLKVEIDYIEERDAEKLVSVVDSAMEHVKPYITKDSFTEDDAIMDFLDNKFLLENRLF